MENSIAENLLQILIVIGPPIILSLPGIFAFIKQKEKEKIEALKIKAEIDNISLDTKEKDTNLINLVQSIYGNMLEQIRTESERSVKKIKDLEEKLNFLKEKILILEESNSLLIEENSKLLNQNKQLIETVDSLNIDIKFLITEIKKFDINQKINLDSVE